MLVLTRELNQKIIVGEGAGQVVFTIVDIRGKHAEKVRVGIEADPATPIHREEIYRAIQAQKGKTMSTGKTKSGLTPADLDELAAAKKTLLKFRSTIEANSCVAADDLDNLVITIDELLAEDVT